VVSDDATSGSLLAIARLVASRAAEDVVFSAVAEQVARVCAVEGAAVLRYLGDERAVVVGSWREGGPRGMPVNAELDFAAGTSALGRVRATGRPARAEEYAGGAGELAVVMHAAGLRASIAAPVPVEDVVWGAVVASTERDAGFEPGAEQRLVPFAELVALSVTNADLDRRMAQARLELLASADAARSQLDRDLHAGPQQHLAALAVKLRVALAAAGADTEAGRLIDDAAAELVEARASLHEIGRGLHPAVLRERGLSAAVLALAARSRLPVSLRELPGRRFAPAIEATAYFAVSEALRNAAEHAEAENAFVIVGDRGDHLVVEIRDDGRGGADPARGAGLRALGQRVMAVGGRLEIESPAGHGTTVRVELAGGPPP
jgi:signal transduction histidine kinase